MSKPRPPPLFLDETEFENLGGPPPIPPPPPHLSSLISRSGSRTATISFSSVLMVTENFRKCTHFFLNCADRISMSNHCFRVFLISTKGSKKDKIKQLERDIYQKAKYQYSIYFFRYLFLRRLSLKLKFFPKKTLVRTHFLRKLSALFITLRNSKSKATVWFCMSGGIIIVSSLYLNKCIMDFDPLFFSYSCSLSWPPPHNLTRE